MKTGRTLQSLGVGGLDRSAIAGDARRGTAMKEPIACLGAGRMGRGIAVVFAYAGTTSRWSISRRVTKQRSANFPTMRSAKCAMCLARSRASGCSIAAAVDDTDGARVRRAGERMRRRRCPPPPSSSKACRKCSTSSARRWRALRSSPDRTPIIASTTSTILVDDLSPRRRSSRALPQRALAQSGLPRAAGRSLARQAHRSGRHGAREGAARKRRQGAGRVRGAAGLHRAAHPGARHERGGAHGRGRRRERRGYRQGDQVRLRHPLRDARHAGVHRLGRRRYSLLREPLS